MGHPGHHRGLIRGVGSGAAQTGRGTGSAWDGVGVRQIECREKSRGMEKLRGMEKFRNMEKFGA